MRAAIWLLQRRLRYGRPCRLRFGQNVPDLPHSTNPLSMCRLSIQVETDLGSRTVVTSAIPRVMASAIMSGLAKNGVHADVRDDRGVHTVKELVKRQQRRKARLAKQTAKVIPIRKER